MILAASELDFVMWDIVKAIFGYLLQLATDRNGQRKVTGGGPCVASIAFVWICVLGNFLFLSSKLVLNFEIAHISPGHARLHPPSKLESLGGPLELGEKISGCKHCLGSS